MKVIFSFFDRKFKFANDYEFQLEMDAIPRIGDEVSLPGLTGGGPLRHKKTKWFASNAVVEGVIWNLYDDPEVAVYCRIMWGL